MRLPIRMLVGPSLLAAVFAAAAGTVNVTFINASSYWDAGNSSWDEEANLKLLERHLQRLGQRLLPADHVLKLDVLQLDLAGTVRAFHRADTRVRVVTGGADWPRIHLRYTLEADGKPLASGQEWVADLDYSRGVPGRVSNEDLYYEKRMLDMWFKARFVDALRGAPG